MNELREGTNTALKQYLKTSILLCVLLLSIALTAGEAFGIGQTTRKPRKSASYDCDFNVYISAMSPTEIQQRKVELESAGRAVELNPKDAKAYYNRALLLGYGDEPIADLTRAVELDKKYEAAYFKRGSLYVGNGKYEQGIGDFTEVIKLNPQNIEAFEKRGSAYLSADKYDLAIADLTHYLKQKTDPHVYQSRAYAYSYSEKPALAIADYTRLLTLCPNNEAQSRWLRNRADEFLKKGDGNRAILDYTRAIRLEPKGAYSYFARGQAYLQLNKNLPAIADFNRTLKYDSEYIAAYGERGVAYKRLRRYDEAISDLTRAIENISDYWKTAERKIYANWYYQRALAYKAKGEIEKSQTDMQRFDEINSKPVGK